MPPVKSTGLDRAIISVFPGWGARRMAMRQAVDFSSSYYDGASGSRLMNNWAVGRESADTALSADLQTLRDRSRDLNRNNPAAAGLTDTVGVNAVGTGLRPQCKLRAGRIPGMTDDGARKFAEQAEDAWERWVPEADARRRLTFYEIQRLALRQQLEAGEFLAVRRALDAKNGRRYMLALDCMEPDRLDSPQKSLANLRLRMGVETNDHGEPVAYHIHKSHPGDSFYPRDGLQFQRVAARDDGGRPLVFHLFDIQRPGQTRGVPWFAPVMTYFRHLADYIEATIVAARIAACFAVFIKSSNPFGGATKAAAATNAKSERLESIQPGMVRRLSHADSVEFAAPRQPTTTFDQFSERILRMIGAGLGLPYELVLKDFSKTNYSSAKAALNQAFLFCAVWQQRLIDHLCQPMWELLIEEAWLRGEIEAPGFDKFRPEYTRALWVPPGRPPIEPFKEANADRVNLTTGTTTLARIHARSGEDWEAEAEQLAREKNKFEKLGLPWPAGSTDAQPEPEEPDEPPARR